MSIFKRAKEDTCFAFVNGLCIDQAFPECHQGHPSHRLWQTGIRIHCLSCGLQAHLDMEQRFILGANLKKECKGAAIHGSPNIQATFQKQQSAHHTATEEATPPTPAGRNNTPPQTNDPGQPVTSCSSWRNPLGQKGPRTKVQL